MAPVGGTAVEYALHGEPLDVVLVVHLEVGQGRIVGIAQAGEGIGVVEHVDGEADHQVLQVRREVDQPIGAAAHLLNQLVVGQDCTAVGGPDFVSEKG